MSKELEFWRFVALRLKEGEPVMLLVVAESSGSSPGRAGYKMAVAAKGELLGSIGGGVMEVNLVHESRTALSDPVAVATGARTTALKQLDHKRDATNASGMICSGKQTVLITRLSPDDLGTIHKIIKSLNTRDSQILQISNLKFEIVNAEHGESTTSFIKRDENEFIYREKLGAKNELYIIGGGHCALALCELMSKMDFYIRIFDDRRELNTLDKNRFADRIEIVAGYEEIADHLPSARNVYVVVMTLGYTFDKIVIEKLLNKEFKYFGVLGSKAKMATLLKELKAQGFDEARLKQIHTPIGIDINSRTPEEIAVSIAAEIISVKNS